MSNFWNILRNMCCYYRLEHLMIFFWERSFTPGYNFVSTAIKLNQNISPHINPLVQRGPIRWTDKQTYERISDKYIVMEPAYFSTYSYLLSIRTPTCTWHLSTCPVYRAEAELTRPSWPGRDDSGRVDPRPRWPGFGVSGLSAEFGTLGGMLIGYSH